MHSASQTFDRFFIAVAFEVFAFAIARAAAAANRPTARPGQFSLASLFVAVTFVAAACGAVRFITLTGNPIVFAVPILVCGAIGALRGGLRSWLGLGVAFDFALVGAMLIWLTFRSE